MSYKNNFSDWLKYIESIHPSTIELGLDRVKCVAARLECTNFDCPVIIVGGTNGKGSTVAMLEALYRAAGLQTGVYTSPHLLRFNERVRLNGKDVEDATFCASFERVERAREETSLTYFEFTTLAALDIFQHADCDVIILEVGLGGRLDATNIVDADISIITTIALDHMEYLGTTREQIAFEKAGIMRAEKMSVCGDAEPPSTLLDHAAFIQTPLRVLGRDFSYRRQQKTWSFTAREICFSELPLASIELQNAATALQAALGLQHRLPFTQAHLKKALQTVQVTGRFQRIVAHGRVHYFDVAHNPAAAMCLARRLAGEPTQGRTLAVWSMLGDKDVAGSVQPLLPLVDEWFCAPLKVSRAAPCEMLITALKSAHFHVYSELEDAYYNAVSSMQPPDRLLIFGSFYTVANLLILLREECDGR